VTNKPLDHPDPLALEGYHPKNQFSIHPSVGPKTFFSLHDQEETALQHPSLEEVVSARVRAHGSGQHFPQFGSKANYPTRVAVDFGEPFLRKRAVLGLFLFPPKNSHLAWSPAISDATQQCLIA
jgi:hypothetical protein